MCIYSTGIVLACLFPTVLILHIFSVNKLICLHREYNPKYHSILNGSEKCKTTSRLKVWLYITETPLALMLHNRPFLVTLFL